MWTWIIVGIVVALAVLLCFALAVASFSFDNYKDKLEKLDSTRNSFGILTLQYVATINSKHFGGRLKLAKCREWQDHYSTGVVALSEKTMQSNSLASLAIVSHELGHARQDASGDTLKKHWKMRRTGRICGFFFLPLIIVGIVLSLLWVFDVLPEIYYIIAGGICFGLGIFIFIFAIILKYKEIKIEKEASVFALVFLREFLTEQEVSLCDDLLKSARLTYWASLIRTLLSWTFLTGKDNMFRLVENNKS